MATRSTLFSSDRERRLWGWTAAAVVAIYSTIGPARAISETLREHNLLRLSLAIVLVPAALVIAGRWIRTRPDRSEVGVAIGVAFTFAMIAARIQSWEERTHLIEYGVVAALIHMALLERCANDRRVPVPAALAVVATAVLGAIDEGIQALLPERIFDVRDIFFNFVAGFMVVAARLAIAPQRGPGWRVWFLWLWATAFGWGQGVYVGWYADDEPKTLEAVPEVVLAGYTGVIAGATLIAVLQWLVLRRHVASARWWIPATLGALMVVGIVIFGLGQIDTEVGWEVGVALFGPMVGVLQWSILRSHVPTAGWWIVASTIGWFAGMPFGDLNGPPGLGAVYGAVTATVLVWLLRRNDLSGVRSA